MREVLDSNNDQRDNEHMEITGWQFPATTLSAVRTEREKCT